MEPIFICCLSRVCLAFGRDRHGVIPAVCLSPRTRGADKTDTHDSSTDAHEFFCDQPDSPWYQPRSAASLLTRSLLTPADAAIWRSDAFMAAEIARSTFSPSLSWGSSILFVSTAMSPIVS